MKRMAPVVSLLIMGLSVSVPADETGAPPEALVDRVVASIGKDAITLFEVRHKLSAARNPVAQIFQGENSDEGAGFVTALDDLIAERLLVAEARKLGLAVSERDVDHHVKGIMDQNGWGPEDFEAAIKMLGFNSAEAYRTHARKELLKGQVLRIKVGSSIRVTDREIDEAFKASYHGGDKEDEVHLSHIVFRIPEQVSLAQIKSIIGHAEQVRSSVVSGEKTFEEAAAEFSEDGTGQRGGDVGYFGRGKLQPSLEAAAFGLKVGEISPVVQSSAGFHILRVTEERRVELKDPEEARARVRYELTERAFQSGLKSYIEELRAAAHVEVHITRDP